MTPYEIKLVALEYQVDTTWQAVMEGFHCGAPEEDQYCGGCVNLMGLYEEAVRSHERAIVAKELNAARQVIAFYASLSVPPERERRDTALRDALVRVMAHTGRSGADGHTHDLSLANGLLDSIARIADAALSATPNIR